jgi:hypothetical protein
MSSEDLVVAHEVYLNVHGAACGAFARRFAALVLGIFSQYC